MAFDIPPHLDELRGVLHLKSEVGLYDPGKWPSIFVQTGHKRTGPLAIVQDPDVLKRVTYHNYDPAMPEFVAYCHSRGVPCLGLERIQEDPVHAGKTQDCWELWLRQLQVLPAEVYTDTTTRGKAGREYRRQKIIRRIYI